MIEPRTPKARSAAPVVRLDAVWDGLPGFARREGEAMGKRVELVATGGEIAVGAGAAQAVRSALADLVRNAVDHGVESPAARVGAGKPPIAILRLSARRVGDDVEITLADDGRGIDPERVRARCVADGRLSRREADGLPAVEAQALVFTAGVTTRRDAAALAPARGAGLGRVRGAVQAAGGRIALTSAPGRGAAFTLTLPAEDPPARARARSAA